MNYQSNAKLKEIIKRYTVVLTHIIMMFLIAITTASCVVMLMRAVNYLFTY